MAGDWIKMRVDLQNHPKVDQLSQILNVDELYTVGALFCFWAWADKHAVDGRVDGATSRLVDRAVRVNGLAEALVAVGWLEIDDKGITLPRFDEHSGDSAKERTLKNQRQARWRERKATGLVDGAASTEASTREEKRREEKSAADKPPQDAPLFAEPSVVDLPLVDGTEYGVRQEQVTAWKASFPAADILQQLRAMGAWLQANPRNRKTPAGIERFIVSWLTKAQDKAPRAFAAADNRFAGAK